jgi:hypothetical protein
MKPLPRWLSRVLAVSGALTASASIVEGIARAWTDKNWFGVLAGLSTLVAALSHSATGTGGQ